MTQLYRSSTQSISVIRVNGPSRTPADDRAVVEEPLEIRLHGRAFSVTMRTPGADLELAAGFLLSERLICGADDLGTIEHCTNPGARGGSDDAATEASPEDGVNIVNVTLTDPSRLEAAFAEQRQVTTSSSCGLCGRRTIESLAAGMRPLSADVSLSGPVLLSLPDRLRAAQKVFDDTGGLHAAGLFTADGALVDAAEDDGRHNAVDKVIGRKLLRDELPLSQHVLFVSGRSSFEIVQKALFAGIPIVGSVSAPSSLAIDLADQMGITLAGFVRGGGFNIYTHAGRIQS
jgi:FdhD protein